MRMLDLLWCLALPLAMSAPRAEPLVTDFRQFLDEVREEAYSSWSQFYRLPADEEKLVEDSKGWLSLHLGSLGNMQNVSRHGNSMVEMDRDGTTRATVNVYIDALEYAFDFSIDSEAFPPAKGCLYGETLGMLGILGLEANMSDTSAVTANVQGLKFQGIGALVMAEATTASLSDKFIDYVSETLGNMLRSETLPGIELQMVNMMNGLLKTTTFNMSSLATSTSTHGQSHITHTTTPHHVVPTTKPHTSNATTTKHPSTSKGITSKHPSTSNRTTTKHPSISNRTTTKHPSTSNTTATKRPSTNKATTTKHPSTSKATSTKRLPTTKAMMTNHTSATKATATKPRFMNNRGNFGVQSLSKATFHITLAPRNGLNLRRGHFSRNDIVCSLSRMEDYSKEPKKGKSTKYNWKNPVNSREFEMPDVSRANAPTTKAPTIQNLLTVNFNKLFDSLLRKTDGMFLSQNLEPYRLPDKEEELYKITDGSVDLSEGRVYGMNTMTLGPDVAVEKNDTAATVSSSIYFQDITYSFKFFTNGEKFSNVSGVVHGNISHIGGELIIVANLTDPTAISATLESFQMIPTMDEFYMNVNYTNKDGTDGVVGEITDAVINDFKVNVVQQLEDMATGVLGRAIAHTHVDMISVLGTTTPSSTPRSTTTTTTPRSSSTTKSSAPTQTSTVKPTASTTTSTFETSPSTTTSNVEHTTSTHISNFTFSTPKSTFTTKPTTSNHTSTIKISTSHPSISSAPSTTHNPNSSSSLRMINTWPTILIVHAMLMTINYALY